MSEPELTVRDLTPPMPVCDSGRHFNHPGDTCEEIDELQAVFRAYLDACAVAAWAEVDRVMIEGDGAGEPRGVLDRGPDREPSPVERALAILDPHLRACPLYTG